ncbi:MAG: beta-galactosidase [Caldilineales bacterium]|nr:beta-galactosidase [Caldilineales bacterium]
MRFSRRVALVGVLVFVVIFSLLTIAIWWVQRPVQVDLGPQQQVKTLNPKAGVHTRLDNEVEPWKIKRTLEMVREMGAPWIVEYFPWAFSEPVKGRYDWEHADLVINHANRQGLEMIARLGYVPEWARPPGTTSTHLESDQFADFAEYAAAFAERYRDRVHYIIIWNEPNLSLEWGYRPVDPEAYVELLRQTATAIRTVNPDVTILAGALAPTVGDPTGELGMSDLDFLQAMYDAGAAPYFDALAVHSYGLTYPPDDPPDPEVVNFRRVELIRQVMEANGDGDKDIHITEAGWNDHPRWTRAVRPAQRIRYTLRAYEMALDWPWLKSLSFWAFRYPWLERNLRDYYTFVTPDFDPKAIYLDVQDALVSGESD